MLGIAKIHFILDNKTFAKRRIGLDAAVAAFSWLLNDLHRNGFE